MPTRFQKKKKTAKKSLRRILPGLLVVILALGLLGLVVKVSLSQVERSRSPNLAVSPEGAADRWSYIMTDLIGQTRHFKGSSDASVTILEFSDFQ